MGIHADHDERERPASIAFDFDDPRKDGEEQVAYAAAEERPAWRPDALDDRANTGEVKDQARGHEENSGKQEFAKRYFGGCGAKPLSGAQAQEHRSERRDEA